MAGNNIVTKTTNILDFKLDRNSYERALKSIKSIKTAWEKTTKSFAQTNPIRKAARDVMYANRRIEQSFSRVGTKQRAEIKKTADYAKRVNTGMASQPTKTGAKNDPGMVARQNRQMYTPGRDAANAAEKSKKEQDKIDNQRRRAAARAAMEQQRRIDAQAMADIRLRSKYGSGYARKLGSGTMGGISRLNADLAAGAISTGRYRASIAALETQFRRTNAGAKGFGDTVKGLRSTLVQATAAYTAFSAGKQVMQTGQLFQGIEASLAMTSENSLDAQNKLSFLREEAVRLGLDLASASKAFMKLDVSSRGKITTEQTRSLFTGVSELSTAMGLDTASQSGAIYAIQQMLSKGKIMAEELQ